MYVIKKCMSGVVISMPRYKGSVEYESGGCFINPAKAKTFGLQRIECRVVMRPVFLESVLLTKNTVPGSIWSAGTSKQRICSMGLSTVFCDV